MNTGLPSTFSKNMEDFIISNGLGEVDFSRSELPYIPLKSRRFKKDIEKHIDQLLEHREAINLLPLIQKYVKIPGLAYIEQNFCILQAGEKNKKLEGESLEILRTSIHLIIEELRECFSGKNSIKDGHRAYIGLMTEDENNYDALNIYFTIGQNNIVRKIHNKKISEILNKIC